MTTQDKIKPTQPYFVFDTKNFHQLVYKKDGISHFYTFTTEEEHPLRVVPDGCIDIVFEYNPNKKNHMHAYVCGTKLKYEIDDRNFHNEIFGVRFMPGNHPDILCITMRQLLQQRIKLEDVLVGSKDWLLNMAEEKTFQGRMEIFLGAFEKAKASNSKGFEKHELLQAVKDMAYESCGKIKVHEMEQKTNYTERYINKIFIEEMGFSPKIFCKIIQFQLALEELNWGKPENMTNTAVKLGYYDQSQFIRDFKKYSGLTPLKYLKMQEKLEYQNRITDNEDKPLA